MRTIAILTSLLFTSTATAQTQFAPPQSFPATSPPTGLLTGDFNRDGNPDIVATTGVTGSLHVGLGLGDGGLNPLTPYSLSGNGAPGDVNSDGFADLALSRTGAGFVMIAVNNGSGGFLATPNLSLGSPLEFAQSARLADMNLDGNLDVIVSSTALFSFSHLLTCLGDGAGGFAPPTLFAITPSTSSIFEVVDVNHDGATDGVTLSNSTGISCFLNNGSGGVGARGGTFYGIGLFASTLDFSDVNLDGFPDAGIASQTASGLSGSTFVALGNGSGQYPVTGVATSLPFPPAGLVFRDVSGDGIADIVLGDGSSNKIVILTVSSTGVLSAPVEIPTSSTPLGGLVATDLDGDGRVDVAHTAIAAGGEITTLRNWTPYPAGISPFGTGTAGCDGIHGLTSNSPPAVGNSNYGYLVTQAPRNTLGLVLSTDVADAAGNDPFGIFVKLHVNLLSATQVYAFDLHTDGFGGGFAPVPIPSNPALQGQVFFTQSLFAWSGTCLPSFFGLSTSRGVVKTIQ